MEKSENHRLKHKSKTLVLDNKEIIDKDTREIPIQENIPRQQYLSLNNQVSPPQNLPIQDASSNYQMQPQINMFPQQYAQPVIIVNQGGIMPQTYYNNNIKTKKIKQETCPHCHQILLTRVEESCNCFSCIIYTIMIILFPVFVCYIAFLDCEGCTCRCDYGWDPGCKPYIRCCSCPDRHTFDKCSCCCDINHYCSNCGKLLSNKNACIEICPPYCRCCC